MSPLGLEILFVLIVGSIALLVFLFLRLVKVVPPNTIMVISGGGVKKILTEGRAIVIPLLHRVDYLPMDLGRHDLRLDNLLTQDGVKARVELSISLKVNTSSINSMEIALRNFLIPEEERKAKIRSEIERAIRELVAKKRSTELKQREIEEALRRSIEELGLEPSIYKLKLSLRG